MTREEFIKKWIDYPMSREYNQQQFTSDLDELLKEYMEIAYTEGNIQTFNDWYDTFIKEL